LDKALKIPYPEAWHRGMNQTPQKTNKLIDVGKA